MHEIRAAVLHAPHEQTVEEIDLDEPRDHEVLVDLQATGVCHTDYRAYTSDDTACPIVLGHEGAGIVESVGEHVTTLSAGDHVVCWAWPYCGKCVYCTGGKPYLCQKANEVRNDRMLDGSRRLHSGSRSINHFFGQSSFATKAVVSEQSAVRIADDVPFDVVAPLGCGGSTGIGAVLNTAQVRSGDTVAIYGCGGVGTSAVLAAKAVGAGKIIAIDIVSEKLERVDSVGATHVVNASRDDPVTRIQEITDDVGVDYAFECIGGQARTIQQALRSLRPGGTAIVTGTTSAPDVEIDASRFGYGVGIVGNILGSVRPQVDIPRYVEMYQNGDLDLSALITQRYPLDELDDALAAIEHGSTTKGVIVFE